MKYEFVLGGAIVIVLCLVALSVNTSMIGVINFDEVIILGSNLSGFDGDFNRSFGCGTPRNVVVDGWVLQFEVDYLYNGSHIIFSNMIFDEHHISFYQ